MYIYFRTVTLIGGEFFSNGNNMLLCVIPKKLLAEIVLASCNVGSHIRASVSEPGCKIL